MSDGNIELYIRENELVTTAQLIASRVEAMENRAVEDLDAEDRRDDLPNPDPCPVCGQHPIGRAVYCSKSCVTMAYNFRKRNAFVLRHLRALGFTVSYTDGVIMDIRVTPILARFYPTMLYDLVWPDKILPLPQLNSDHLWDVIRDQFGTFITGFLRWSYDSGLYADDRETLRALLRSAREWAMFEPDQHFTCRECHRTFINSKNSRAESDLCCDCQIAAIPF